MPIKQISLSWRAGLFNSLFCLSRRSSGAFHCPCPRHITQKLMPFASPDDAFRRVLMSCPSEGERSELGTITISTGSLLTDHAARMG